MSSLLFERLSANKSPGGVRALARGQEVAVPREVIEDPFALEFLDLQRLPTAHERDLEQAIVDRLDAFLLEMGKGFCFWRPSSDDAMVKITLPDEEQIVAARYQAYLPTEDELRTELTRERDEAERVLRLTGEADDSR